ncbi:MAG: LysM peptidoglycan-binding domain-containing protein [Chloroflexi bacterium]|nr:MAG: LysM peptidoglycan-binding domain-containing protein [Chloroflexota bacterium]
MTRLSVRLSCLAVFICLIIGACTSQSSVSTVPTLSADQVVSNDGELLDSEDTPVPEVTPFPTRPPYGPGELVDYTAQTGDTLPALVARFNTTEQEIRIANPIIPADATTMPPGMPMKIPIYYLPFWGTPYQILPDCLFVNGPLQIGFETASFVESQPGWLKYVVEFTSGRNRTGAEIVDYVALSFSVSPRMLLALLDYQSGALSEPVIPAGRQEYPLGYEDDYHRGVYMQLVWAANALNNGYYAYREGTLTTFELNNGRIERPDPWQNAGTVSLQHFFANLFSPEAYAYAVSPEGFASTYQKLFGDPWQSSEAHIPGSLVQPPFTLPFELYKEWAYTGGPHTAWGQGAPLAAIDFAPPSVAGGCMETDEWATAVAAGVVARSEPAIVVLDLDRDGDERTGWNIFYLHLATEGRVQKGTVLNPRDRVGHPSCEGGTATGTHIHIARKYNGEWISAAGTLAINLEGWIVQNGSRPYLGTLIRYPRTVTANAKSDGNSHIQSEGTP